MHDVVCCFLCWKQQQQRRRRRQQQQQQQQQFYSIILLLFALHQHWQSTAWRWAWKLKDPKMSHTPQRGIVNPLPIHSALTANGLWAQATNTTAKRRLRLWSSRVIIATNSVVICATTNASYRSHAVSPAPPSAVIAVGYPEYDLLIAVDAGRYFSV